jgi:4-amino-4-deoxy-L-arabinose transferase-like glycosyltransferase
MLALGSRFGVPWLVNPLLAGLCVLLAYGLARELVPAGSARLATLLLSLSPWFLFLAMSFMAHIFTLACVLGAALAVAQLRRQPGVAAAVIAGVLLGVTSLIRPLDGLAAALVLGLWSLGIPTWRDRIRYIPVLVLATAATGALVLPYNALLTGDPAVFPVTAYFDQHYGVGSNALGFGPDRGMDWRGLDPFPGHGLRDVIVNSYLNTFGTNVELFGWASGSLWLVLILFFSGRARLMDYRLLLAVLVVTGLHALYWFSGGPDFGARYWFLAIVPLVLLSVRATAVVAAGGQQSDTGRTRIVTGMLVLSLSALLTFMPWRSIDKYHHYNNMRPDIRLLAHEHDFSNGLVLVRGKRFDDYMSAAVYNSADLEQGSVIYAWDRDAQTRDALVKALPDRTVWLVNGPTVTGSGFRVSAGPFTGAAPLPRWTDPAAAAGTR